MNDQDYAIIIGIDAYVGLRPLLSAVKDATAFAEWLVSPAGGDIPDKNINLITSPATAPADPFDAKPIKQDIDRALRDLGIERKKRLGRRLYFYFAGHGVGPDFDEVAMLMADAGMERLNSNIGMRLYRRLFQTVLLFDEVVFILDCCRDPTIHVDPAPPAFKPGVVAPVTVQDFVVLAAAWGAKAFDPADAATNERRGLLTTTLLQGLRGEAANAEGDITAFSLREYVLQRVPKLASAADKQQIPQIFSPQSGNILFGKVAPERLCVHIVLPPHLTGEMILYNGTDRRVEERRPAAGATLDERTWKLKLLRNSRYELEHTASDLSVVVDPRKAQGEPYIFRFPQPV